MTAALTRLALVALALVATPSAHVAPGLYTAPHRAPDALWTAELSDAAKVVWSVIRQVQGGRAGEDVRPARATMDHYGALCNKSRNAVEKNVKVLVAWGWLEDCGAWQGDRRVRLLRCHVGAQTEPVAPGDAPEKAAPQAANNPPPRRASLRESRLPGENNPPPRREKAASQADSPTPPYKEESYQGILSGNPTTTTVEVDGKGEPSADVGGVVVLNPADGNADAGPERDAKNRAWKLLDDRGVAAAVELARQHWQHVPAAVEVYDQKLAAGLIDGPGWFAGALPRWTAPRPTPARQASTHTGPLPEADRARAAAAAAREAPPAAAETVASSVADIEAATEAGRRAIAERQERLREERRMARRPPTVEGT